MSRFERYLSLWVALAMVAIFCLPRQFQVAIVEIENERHLATAAWLFPLYLFLISLFVIPIALAGLTLLAASLLCLAAVLVFEAAARGSDWRTPWLRCLAPAPLLTLAWLLGAGEGAAGQGLRARLALADKELRDNPALPPEARNDTIAPAVNPYNWQDHIYSKNQPENLDFLRKLRAKLISSE